MLNLKTYAKAEPSKLHYMAEPCNELRVKMLNNLEQDTEQLSHRKLKTEN